MEAVPRKRGVVRIYASRADESDGLHLGDDLTRRSTTVNMPAPVAAAIGLPEFHIAKSELERGRVKHTSIRVLITEARHWGMNGA